MHNILLFVRYRSTKHVCVNLYIYVVVAYILYDEGGAVIVVSRPRGVAHGHDDECFWASRGDRKTPQNRDDIIIIIIIKRYIIIIINYYCHVRVSPGKLYYEVPAVLVKYEIYVISSL